jgi:hypothetical protein
MRKITYFPKRSLGKKGVNTDGREQGQERNYLWFFLSGIANLRQGDGVTAVFPLSSDVFQTAVGGS